MTCVLSRYSVDWTSIIGFLNSWHPTDHVTPEDSLHPATAAVLHAFSNADSGVGASPADSRNARVWSSAGYCAVSQCHASLRGGTKQWSGACPRGRPAFPAVCVLPGLQSWRGIVPALNCLVIQRQVKKKNLFVHIVSQVDNYLWFAQDTC